MLVILRGLPGSGKSTLALGYPEPRVICSADSFFVSAVDGSYHFDPRLLGAAHEQCRSLALATLRHYSDDECVIVIDNTNSRYWEFAQYRDMARDHGHTVSIRDLFDGGLSNAELAHRNSHGVPESSIARMRDRWEF